MTFLAVLALAGVGAVGARADTTFTDAAESVKFTGGRHAAAWGDFNNDGWVDLAASGELWRNESGKRFVLLADVPNGGPKPNWGDFDNDGDLDLIAGGKLFTNRGHGRHWLKVRLVGGGRVNRAAIGTQVRVRRDGETLTRHVSPGTGEGNQNDLTLHFGFGDDDRDVTLHIRWTDGTSQTITTPVDRTITVRHAP